MSYDPNDAKSIFLQATELSSATERATFLDQACAGKPELKARVETLLKTAFDPDSLLDQPVVEFGATRIAPQCPVVEAASLPADAGSVGHASPVSLDFLEASDATGSLGRLGGYEVLEVIGRGGMGVVLRAMDAKLNRVVAIKVLAPELASQPQARKRFLREAQAAAAVSHDHVVTIHAVDDNEKVPLLVMECVVGQSLQQKIDKIGALQLKEILRIGMQIASGLAAAHKQGLVHRDIKPANILLENGIERVKITDFGLARATDDVGITQSGQIAGTPQYMSPEQAMGQSVDQRSDLFSLGSVLYTMCTGRPAFRAESAVAVLRRVCDDTPRPINEVNAEVPDWLIAIVNRLMAKKPEDRYQTAREVASVLEQALAHVQQPETVARPHVSIPQNLTQSEAASSGVLLQAWQQWWSERDRWFTVSVQSLFVLAYVVCMICFISFSVSNGRNADGQATFVYQLGVPSPWFKFEVYPEPLTPFRFGFFPWASSVLIGLLGSVAYFVYWRIEKVRNPKMSRFDRPAYMLGCWGVGAVIAVVVGQWLGYSEMNKPRVAVAPAPQDAPQAAGTLTLPMPDGKPFDWKKEFAKLGTAVGKQEAVSVDFNGDWDSGWGPVTLSHPQITGIQPVEVSGYYHNGKGRIRGKLDPQTRTFRGSFHEPNGNGRLQLILSADGTTIDGGFDYLDDPLEQVPPKQPWRMTRQNPQPATAPFDAEQAKQHQEEWAKYRGVPVEYTNSIGMKLRLIPPGEFTQGTSPEAAGQVVANPTWYFTRWVKDRREAERPPRVVQISQPMYVGAHEVTVGQFAEFLKDTTYKTEAETETSGGYAWCDGQWQRDATARWHNPGFTQTHDHPVSNISWKDAAAFCEWLGQKEGVEYRLPREAEWEYACRAGTTTLFSTGDDPASLAGFANIADAAVLEHHKHMTWATAWNDGFAFTAPVGSFKPNNFGLFDMHGNVHEWCFDGYDANAYAQSPAIDPVFVPTESGRHVYRGGGWDNWVGFCRSADRYGSHSELLRTDWAGFRVVRTFVSPKPPSLANTMPRSVAPIDLNGDWDSRWNAVTFTHELPKPGETTIPVSATYYNGSGKIEGTLNLDTRTFEGRFRETNGMNGPIRLVVAADGRAMTGRYAYHRQDGDPTDLTYEWDMARRGTSPKTSVTKSESTSPPRAIAPFDAAQARQHQEAWARYRGVPVENENSLGMKLRLIPPGKFQMGSTPEELAQLKEQLEQSGASDFDKFIAQSSGPRHVVELSQPFYMSQHEVTVALFRQFVDETSYQPSAERAGNAHFTWKSFVFEADAAKLPVCGVSWEDAKAFCQWLTGKTAPDQNKLIYDLPTEAQWEYACRAGSQSLWSFGDDAANLSEHAIVRQKGMLQPAAVGLRRANAFGLFDMHGNVDEWCLDWHNHGFYGRTPLVDPVYLDTPQETASGRVARGGSWNGDVWWARSATRAYDFPTSPTFAKGFRIVGR